VSLLLGLAPDLCHGGSGSDVDRLVVGHLDDQILELGLENLARQHALLQPALDLPCLTAGIGEPFGKGFGR